MTISLVGVRMTNSPMGYTNAPSDHPLSTQDRVNTVKERDSCFAYLAT
jgi:hypothetical protein